MKLKNTLRHIMGADLVTHLGLDYYDLAFRPESPNARDRGHKVWVTRILSRYWRLGWDTHDTKPPERGSAQI
jgi:hypothetical protein